MCLQVNGMKIQPWMGELLPILLEMLGDASSPEKRGVALWALGQLVGATGFVVRPYNQYPALLDTLINFLKTEQQPIIRFQLLSFFIYYFFHNHSEQNKIYIKQKNGLQQLKKYLRCKSQYLFSLCLRFQYLQLFQSRNSFSV